MKKIISFLLITSFCNCFANEVIPSALDKLNERRREKAYEPWIAVAEQQARFDEFNEDGEFPVYSEREKGKIRTIYIDKPDGLAYWSWASMSQGELLLKHKQYTTEGFVLLSLSTHSDYNGGQRYWATWVNQSRERKLLRELKRFGISQAFIKKGTPHTPQAIDPFK